MPELLNDAQQQRQQSKSIYSVPVTKEDKEFLLNESARTGLSQKELVKRAVIQLKLGPSIASALPVRL